MRITTQIRTLWSAAARRLPGRRPAATLARWDSAESLQRRFSDTAKRAEGSAYLKAYVFNSGSPSRDAKAAAKRAVAADLKRVQDHVAKVGAAERAHIKARHAVRMANLRLHQTRRTSGEFSILTHVARQESLAATKALGMASAELYLAQIETF